MIKHNHGVNKIRNKIAFHQTIAYICIKNINFITGSNRTGVDHLLNILSYSMERFAYSNCHVVRVSFSEEEELVR